MTARIAPTIVNVDNRKRATLPGVHPGDQYRVEPQANGVIVLVPVETSIEVVNRDGEGH